MWKRDDAVKPAVVPAPAGSASLPVAVPDARPSARDVVHIGKLVVIRGELTGGEDLTVEGRVEGRIDLPDNILTVGPHGRITAEVYAKQVIVLGEILGNVRAAEKVDIRDHGSVNGDISAPKVAIAEGAHFKGSVDMQRTAAPKTEAAAGTEVSSDEAPSEVEVERASGGGATSSGTPALRAASATA